ncbi:chromosome segregation protein SMC [Ferrimonas sediminicola]|uniref:Chromosome partition protein Smc n=1 Tax=Ferrimonas sediminicola TaxID=2569538 RepID=A0A4U1BH20_9GAMM|nr:chromosome segregation protein SMC [Ferrimonas sediminicola]TKB50658.1 chromosome segregation protein SMC [Ferrimonas sediminicola]
MRLKQIKLAGFKSFADPTKVPFPAQMTAIVGPNGCGKSNVIDAVRWVLGESSAKNLRGDAMTDVIFNGSGSRQASSVASVELVFDNSSGRVGGQFATFAEVSIKRQVNRDAQSSYFLNGNKCRRRDITDIFMGTGLGPRSYAIIEQGMISRLIESRPQELRVFIEEAAGISKYKERRRETENRIKHTRENLERLADVRTELGAQLERLQRQADAARRYRTHKANERTLQNQLFALRWRELSDRMGVLESQLAEKETEHQQCQSAQQGDLSTILTLEQSQSDIKAQLAQQQQALYLATSEVTRLEQQILHGRQRHQQLEEEIRRTQAQLDGDEGRRQALIEERQELAEQLEMLEPELEMAAEALMTLEEELEQLLESGSDQQSELYQSQHQVSDLTRQRDVCRTQQAAVAREQAQLAQRQARLQAQLPVLAEESGDALEQARSRREELGEQLALRQEELAEQKQLRAECADLRRQAEATVQQVRERLGSTRAELTATRTLIEGLQQRLPAPYDQLPRVWQQIEIDSRWQVALEQVLGEWLQAVISDDTPLPEGLMALTQADSGSVHAQSLLARVTSPLNLAPWLGQVLCADDLEAARRRLPDLQPHQSLVTPRGEWLGQGFVRQPGAGQRSVLALTDDETRLGLREAQLESELDHAAQALEQANHRLAQCEQRVQEGERLCNQDGQALMQAELELQKLSQQTEHQSQQRQQALEQLEELALLLEQSAEQALELEQQQEQLDTSLEQQQARLAQLQGQHQSHQGQSDALRARVAQQQAQLQQTTLQRQTVSTRLQGIEAQLGQQQGSAELWRGRLEEAREQQQELLEPLAERQMELEAALERRSEQEQAITALNAKMNGVEAQLARIHEANRGQIDRLNTLTQAITELKMEHEGLRVQAQGQLDLLAESEVSLKLVLDQLPADAAVASWQEELTRVRERIKRLGAINLAAIEEYEQQSQRKRYLDEQNDDLTEALDTLESAIRKIDRETRQRFKATFDEVNQGLGELFPKVFGGGSAYLALTDDDLLETGVTIMARPPGKKNATIHLLSGGEKALTALSLVFAIFRLNPAPFCLLDEVDAPLDDANVGRFCRLVKEMSETVQFIYISHNKVSMEMADQLTGVTMHEPGASRIVAVNVEEAAAMAQL